MIHSSHAAFQRDHRRSADLSANGYTVLCVTWHQLMNRPLVFAARLAATLAIGRERADRQIG